MKPIPKLLITLGALAALAVPGVSALPAYAGGDNAAAAVNTTDGKTVYRIAINVTRNNTRVVTNTNIALAYSTCTGCNTVAVAFQMVLETANPTVVAPTNLAIAENFGCTDCTTVAEATQVAVMTDGQVHFRAAGYQMLASIRRDLQALRSEDLTFDQLVAQVQFDANEFTCLVSPTQQLPPPFNFKCSVYDQLVPAGNR
ncbi:MAG TPA: hypothetical protein VFR68_06950 [Candidatus Dormibacteraeota bacterium]|nr:hypothetical protein [Candidatus Dormibacteraeota bacterium]